MAPALTWQTVACIRKSGVKCSVSVAVRITCCPGAMAASSQARRAGSSSDMMSSSSRIGSSPDMARTVATSASFSESATVRCCPREP